MDSLYLITGICGHLGNNIARLLLARGARVRGFELPSRRGKDLFGGAVEMFYGDIRDKAQLEPLFAGCAHSDLIVIHAASVVSIATGRNPLVEAVNVGGTANITALCEKHAVRKLVYISSVHAIPEAPQGTVITETEHFVPDAVHGLYAKTKCAATALVLQAAARGLNACVVHPSGIIGPGDYGHGHITQLIESYARGSLLAAVKGGYDFVDVRDAAEGVLACCERGLRGRCYILSNRYFTVRELLDALAAPVGRKKLRLYVPMWVARAAAPFAEAWSLLRHETPLFTPYSLFTLESNSLFSHARATSELGYSTRPLADTAADTAAWLREQGRI